MPLHHPASRALPVVCALFLAACGPASTGAPVPESGREISVGQTLTATLDAATPVYGERGPFHLYRFDARAGERVTFDMRSDDFDAYLVVGERSTGIFNPLKENDDAGGDTNARVHFDAPANGTYWVVAQALGSDEAGAYTLSMEALPAMKSAGPIALEVGSSVQGALESSDRLLDADDSYYDLYTFPVREGKRYEIVQTSEAFDAFLQAGPWRDGEVDVVLQDDDGAGGTDARIVVVADTDGTIGILANSLSGGALGPYTLRVESLPDPGPIEFREIAYGQTVQGKLTVHDAILDDGTPFDVFLFQGSAGDEILITLRSGDFDAYLSFGLVTEGGFTVLESDDDGAGDLDAELRYRLTEDGEYAIRANSVRTGASGTYDLTLRRF